MNASEDIAEVRSIGAQIASAQEEIEEARAKLAESVHAELYLDAYNNIDAEDDRSFYLCPVCGYIHKGDDFEKCPICFTAADKFRAF